MTGTSTRTSRHVNAPRANVYRALLDARAVATWMVPIGMTSHVHVFDAREGGLFRISLTYDEPTGTGKTTAQTDTYHGHFVKLVPNAECPAMYHIFSFSITTTKTHEISSRRGDVVKDMNSGKLCQIGGISRYWPLSIKTN
jgi:hypothetical protein